MSAFIISFLLSVFILVPSNAQKKMENLNRGVLAVRTGSNSVLISWRILGTEFDNASYNVYRGTTLLNSSPITGASCYTDATAIDYSYSVAAVINGVEQKLSDAVSVWSTFYKSIPITAPSGGTTPDGVSYTYEANDASVGDLDGDGDYEIVLKWMPTNSKDNSTSGYTGNTILQGLEMNGTVLWTINLGKNIRSGAHYTQFMVYDLDSDGKAEVACKTADGTVDGTGVIIGSTTADYRNSSGYILSGPEYFTIFSGKTGAALVTNNYLPARGTVSDWGDSYGNRVDRFLACVAYLDGKEPSLVFCRGYYTRVVLVAWDYRNGNLSQRWIFDSDNGYSSYYGQGNHNLAVGDLDGDGYDEIQYGSCAIDHNGKGLYSTGFGHGDAGHLGDFNPNRSGLEFFMCHETANGSTIPGLDFRDPANGNVLWSIKASGDIGRGLTADIDPNFIGAESWGSDGSGVYSCTGTKITTTYPTTAGGGATYNMAVWYDGDVLRELVDRTVITKWNASSGSTDRVLTAYNYDVTSNNSTKYNPCLIADILGDWREEIIWRNSSNTELKIFTSTTGGTERIYTLMHDPLYRTSIAWQNVGYNQSAHTSFYLGMGMSTPSAPNIELVGATPGTISLSASIGIGQVNLSWSATNISTSYQLFRDTDSDPSGRVRIATVSNSINSFTDSNVSDGTTYYYWVKSTDIYGNTVNSNIASGTPNSNVTITIQENETGFCGVDGTVDSNNNGFTGDGFANTLNSLGNGVDYKVTFGKAGNYTFTFRYASTSERPANLIVGGTIMASNISFPSTGAWTTWSTVSVTVSISAGTNDVRLESTGSTGLGNIDYMSVSGASPSAASCLAAASIVSGETYVITARHSGLAIDVEGASSSDGANVLTWAYLGGANQKWIVSEVETGYYSLKPSHATSLGMDVYNISTSSGANINVWSYWGGTGQQYQLNSTGDGYYTIAARNSGLCLDVEGASTSNGANIQQWNCTSGAEWQQFKFELASLKSAEFQVKETNNLPELRGLFVYPNPNNTDELTISTSVINGSTSLVNIYNATGSLLKTIYFGETESNMFTQTIDISDLNVGIYIIQIQIGQSVQLAKLIRK
ncbi:MAG: RICIN domain-containing protein [Marinilabiliaceae bacterium]|nr:RICIN domain-containing protein [Marinilabiliaceae bacterium]